MKLSIWFRYSLKMPLLRCELNLAFEASSILCCPEWQGGADRSKWPWPGKATGAGSGGSAEPLVAAPDQSSSSWSRPEATALASQTKIMISLELFNPLSDLPLVAAHDQSSSSWSRPEATALASQTKIMISLELFNPLSEKIIPNAHDTQHKYHIYMCCH